MVRSSNWKKIILMPGPEGGTVYWRIVETRSNRTTLASEYRSMEIEPPKPAGNSSISTTSRTSLPIISWENNCNKKFKVYVGSDETFARKVVLTINVSDPTADGGITTKQLTSSQWSSMRRLVGDVVGATLYAKIGSWDGANRSAVTEVGTLTLTE